MKDTPNVILIVFDTMRKDASSIYGGYPLTPNLEAFAKEAIVYDNCVAPSPWTTPSHASFFTGKYPSEHGIHETREKKVPQLIRAMNQVKTLTLPESFRKSGYNTIGFSANGNISPKSGFDLGFNVFQFFDEGGRVITDRRVLSEASSELGLGAKEAAWDLLKRGKISKLMELYSVYRQTRRRMSLNDYPLIKAGDRIVQAFLDSSVEQPFFLFVNFMEMHEPYVRYEYEKKYLPIMLDLFKLKPIPNRVMQTIKRQYYLSVNALDTFFGYFIRYLKENGMYSNSLIIATSDHGQALKERGYYGHGIFLHDEIIDVPLLVKYPLGKQPNRSPGYQNLVHLPEMINATLEGGSIDQAITKDVSFSESYGYQNSLDFLSQVKHGAERMDLLSYFETPRKAVYKDGYKLVINGKAGDIEEFSRLGKILDPRENRAALEPLVEELQIFRGLEKFLVPEVR